MMQHIAPMFGRSLLEKSLGRGRSLRLLLALLLGLQALTAASHLHAHRFYPAGAANGEISSQPFENRQPADDPANCSICHLLSIMGNALLPSGIAVSLSGILIWWGVSASLSAQVCRVHSQGWRSRAPPVLS